MTPVETTSTERPVVVGVDGSEDSVQAAIYAAGVARRRGLPLLVVHVTPWRLEGEAMPMTSLRVREQYEESARVLVDAAAGAVREATGFSDVTATVIDDYPVDGLLSLSGEAAVVVIGARGVGGVTGLLFGSTAGAVVQHAACPVIVLPHRHGDGPEAGGARGAVVVGVEGRPGDEEVLAFAVAEAASRGTALTAVHAWQDIVLEASAMRRFGPFVPPGGAENVERRVLAEALGGWREKEPDVEIREQVVHGRPAAALLTAAESAELLVVGHRHRRLLARLGSTTHGVLHRAACPVAVVPLGDRP